MDIVDQIKNKLIGNEEKILEEVEKHVQEIMIPKILVGGTSGAGKSSILNGIIGKEIFKTSQFSVGTKSESQEAWNDMIVIDVPGFNDYNGTTINGYSAEEFIKHLGREKSNIFLYVINFNTGRNLGADISFINNWNLQSDLAAIPTIIVINRPLEDVPDSANLHDKAYKLNQYIQTCISPVFKQYAANDRIVSVMTYITDDQNKNQYYNFEVLRKKIYELLPESHKTIFARISQLKSEESKRIITRFSIATALICLQPIPFIDSLLIAPVQVAMIIHLGKVYGKEVTKSTAWGIYSCVITSVIANFIFLVIADAIPIAKQIIGPTLAFSMNWILGKTINELFSNGNFSENLSKEIVDKLTKKYKDESKEMAERYKNDFKKVV